MCGIFLAISKDGYKTFKSNASEQALSRRGPDSLISTKFTVATNSSPSRNRSDLHENQQRYIHVRSSVLSLRGDVVCGQPIVDKVTGHLLCWNGEAWKIGGTTVRGNDTQEIFQLLVHASSHHTSDGDLTSGERIINALTKVAGPYAFVFYDPSEQMIYYGRDRLGRRSLVIDGRWLDDGQLIISSIGDDAETENVTEVLTSGLFRVRLDRSDLKIEELSWPTPAPTINKELPDEQNGLLSIPTSTSIHNLVTNLTNSVRLRLDDIPTFTPTSTSLNPSRVAVLFSGGLDCTLLARIANDVLPIGQPIDLLNVGFENPRVIGAAGTKPSNGTNAGISPYELCPDRITGRCSFAELMRICPSRSWRFVAIDIPYAEYLSERSTIISLMKPHNTEMDLSITAALYFAARGQGLLKRSGDVQAGPAYYTTTARVLLSGLGADELFGGYTRHATAFTHSGFSGLANELELDFNRIGTRNLGRDDRIISHFGREVRYPFLDEDFVQFSLHLPSWEKCGFRKERIVPKHFEDSDPSSRVIVNKIEDLDPAKILLRCAAWHLGMQGVAAEKKRAIQFGARTAKMQSGRRKGTDVVLSER